MSLLLPATNYFDVLFSSSCEDYRWRNIPERQEVQLGGRLARSDLELSHCYWDNYWMPSLVSSAFGGAIPVVLQLTARDAGGAKRSASSARQRNILLRRNAQSWGFLRCCRAGMP